MNTRHGISTFTGALLLSALSMPVLGETIPELGDDNSAIDKAQFVDVSSGSVTIDGKLVNKQGIATLPGGLELPGGLGGLNNATGLDQNIDFEVRDVDFYSFIASAGDHIVVDIDNGTGGEAGIDTKIGIFGPESRTYPLLIEEDRADAIDEGSEDYNDPYIDGFPIEADGKYTVVVVGGNAILADGGEVLGGGGEGDYLLRISGSSDPAISVDIAITQKKFKKKGKKRGKMAHIDLKKKKHVKVAIFGSKDLSVSDIDPSSLTFGAAGDEDTLRKCKSRTKDLNKDGEPDLECKFSLRDSGFNEASQNAVLKGWTTDNKEFSGADRVKVKGKLKGKGKG